MMLSCLENIFCVCKIHLQRGCHLYKDINIFTLFKTSLWNNLAFGSNVSISVRHKEQTEEDSYKMEEI